MGPDPIDDAVRNFLGDRESAQELRQLREALQDRLRKLRAEAAREPESAEALAPRIENVKDQIRVLMDEEAITGFVEDTVRAAVLDAGPVGYDSPPHESSIPPWASLDIDDPGEG